MTEKDVKEYKSILRQIKYQEEKIKGLTYVTAVDTSKASVQTSNQSNTTSDYGIDLMNINEELRELKAKKISIESFINSHQGEDKEILIYISDGLSHNAIKKEMHYSRSTILRKIKKIFES